MDEHPSRSEDGLLAVSLADRFDLAKSPVLLNGAQAVARLLLAQKERDRRAGLNTAGFVTGYRGSPVGGLDLQFARLAEAFKANAIHFEPGLNEELAATAVWGAQQAEMRGEGRFDGVFGLWYGKGPGVDRCGDVFRHANLAGTSPHGGVLALMGDDHTAESSTTAHQSEFAFVDVMMPILSPAGVQEVLDYGALGWALSRYAGVWVGLKCIKDTIESTAVVDGVARPRRADRAGRLSNAAGRPEHPDARWHSRAGSASAGAQARRRGRLDRRQQAQSPDHQRRPRRQDRRHHARQVLSRHAAGARRSRRRRGALQRAWPAPLQARLRLADRAGGPARIRAGSRADHRRGGKALADRGAGARGIVRRARPADVHRQEGRGGALAVSGEGRPRPERHRHRDRRTPAEIQPRRSARGARRRGPPFAGRAG